jgi:hypothetical protein
MAFYLITRAAALIAVLGTAVVYGTDVFCAIVLRPALALVDDRALVAVMGSVHRYGDRRTPVPNSFTVSSAIRAQCGRFPAVSGISKEPGDTMPTKGSSERGQGNDWRTIETRHDQSMGLSHGPTH